MYMMVGVRCSQWILASVAVTWVIILLFFTSKPLQNPFSTKPQPKMLVTVSVGQKPAAASTSPAQKPPPHYPHHALQHLSISHQEPINSYTRLRDKSERLLLSSLKQEFQGDDPWDIQFTPGLPVPKSRVRRVLVLSTWRSGSTFLGDLLKSYPGTFYVFEPLHPISSHLKDGPLVPAATKLLRDIMTCNFHEQEGFVNNLRNNTFLIKHNNRYWKSCSKNKIICFDKKYLSKACEFMPVNLIKTVRMGLSPVMELLEDPNLDLRVIHLVRDPRGTLHSRSHIYWCRNTVCNDPDTVCKDLLTDLNLSTQVKERFPDRYLLVRYEDLGTEPERMAQEIFKFIGLNYHSNVEKFIHDHTSLNTTNTKNKVATYTTYRDSKATTFAWRDALNFTTVNDIQNNCMESLELLGLRRFETEKQYNDKSIPVLLDE